MYPLLEIAHDRNVSEFEAIRQGGCSALCFGQDQDRERFIDMLLLEERRHPRHDADLRLSERTIRLRVHMPSDRIGLVSASPTLLGHLSAHENLELVSDQVPCANGGHFSASLRKALRETGLLSGVELSRKAEDLPWATQVEINFLQAWLREPEWLWLDGVFDHEAGRQLSHLPILFRQRYPLRAICHLGRMEPMSELLNVRQVIKL